MSASLIGRLGSSTHQPSLLKSPVPTMLQPLGREPTPTEDFIVAPFMNHSAGRRRKEFGAPQQLRLPELADELVRLQVKSDEFPSPHGAPLLPRVRAS